MEEALLSIRDVGRYLGYTGKSSGKTTIYKHINERRLSKVVIGGRAFVTRQSAEDLIRCSIVSGNDGFEVATPEMGEVSHDPLPAGSLRSVPHLAPST